jgi:MinD-like ATPase involved in chromosome partitioning or flagellar assembly
MTIVGLASFKGAPGVTTLSCLVGANWPADRRVFVAECDAHGNDLAVRFQMSSRIGISSVLLARRRSGGHDVAVGPHLQRLPGGLAVMVGQTGSQGTEAAGQLATLITEMGAATDGPWDVLVDFGRLSPDLVCNGDRLHPCDTVVVCLRNDATSVLHARERAHSLLQKHDRVTLAVIGARPYSSADIEQFTGVPVLAIVPWDPSAAGVAAGQRSGVRRLLRSPLVAASRHLAEACTDGYREYLATERSVREDDGSVDIAHQDQDLDRVESNVGAPEGPDLSRDGGRLRRRRNRANS